MAIKQQMIYRGVTMPVAYVKILSANFDNSGAAPTAEIVLGIYASEAAYSEQIPPIEYRTEKFTLSDAQHLAMFEMVSAAVYGTIKTLPDFNQAIDA